MNALERWADALKETGVDDAGIAERTRVLEEFCVFAGTPPDDLVERCVDREKGRIVPRERKQVEALIAQFAEETSDGAARAGTERANVVRSFLIHNGVRVLAPVAPWLRGQSDD